MLVQSCTETIEMRVAFYVFNERLIQKPQVWPLLSEIPLTVTSGIFNGATGKLDMLVVLEIGHESVIFIAASEVSAAFAFTVEHSSLQYVHIHNIY